MTKRNRPALLAKGMRDGKRYKQTRLEQVGVTACVYKLQYESVVVLQPYQQPIWLQMAFPITKVSAR